MAWKSIVQSCTTVPLYEDIPSAGASKCSDASSGPDTDHGWGPEWYHTHVGPEDWSKWTVGKYTAYYV